VNPISLQKVAFDATNNEIFYFTSNGGDQVVKNRLTIRRQSDNSIVYQATVETFLFQHTLPSGTLTNGTYYNYYFNTYDVADNMSTNSNVVAFYCYTTPTITFTNYPSTNIINSASYEFSITYDQAEGELLDYLKYHLYDSMGNEISNSGELRSALTPPLAFTHTFSGFEDSETYKIQIKATSINGAVALSELKTFSISVFYPELFSQISAENLCNDGVVRLTSNVVAVEGTTNIEPSLFFSHIADEENTPDYIMWDEWYNVGDDMIVSTWAEKYMLDLRASGTILTFASGFSIPTDFQFQSWQYPIRDGVLYELYKDILGGSKIIIELKSGIPSGESTVKNWFELYTDNGELFDYSNYVDAMKDDTNFIVWFKKVGDVYTLLLDVVSVGTGTTISWTGVATYPSVKTHNNISGLFPLDTVTIQNGSYDNLDITNDTSRVYSQSFPIWNYYTRINCNFSTLDGGNIDIVLSQLQGIKLKRRLKGTFDWITLYYVSIVDASSLSFVYDDKFAPNNLEFDYAVVPILSGSIEGDYIITSVTSTFDGCFICDKDNIFKLYNACSYSTITNSLTAGILTPIGRRYPILVYNTENDFESGTFNGNLLGYNFEETRQIDRADVQDELNDYRVFLKNRKAKILKDWNGKIQLIGVTGGIAETPDLISGKTNVNFAWVEQGQYDNQLDLYENGLITASE